MIFFSICLALGNKLESVYVKIPFDNNGKWRSCRLYLINDASVSRILNLRMEYIQASVETLLCIILFRISFRLI